MSCRVSVGDDIQQAQGRIEAAIRKLILDQD